MQTKDVGSSDKALASAGVDVQAAHKDKALALLAKVDIEFDPSSETAKRVLRKIDSRILPLVYSIYIFMLIVSHCTYNVSPSATNLHFIGQEQHVLCSYHGN